MIDSSGVPVSLPLPLQLESYAPTGTIQGDTQADVASLGLGPVATRQLQNCFRHTYGNNALVYSSRDLTLSQRMHLDGSEILMIQDKLPDARLEALSVYQLDYLPIRNAAYKDNRIQRTVTGLVALHNYVFLTEQGIIPPPDIITGLTNQRMARLATKAGFEARHARTLQPLSELQKESLNVRVMATYDDVRNAITTFGNERLKRLVERANLPEKPVTPAIIGS